MFNGENHQIIRYGENKNLSASMSTDYSLSPEKRIKAKPVVKDLVFFTTKNNIDKSIHRQRNIINMIITKKRGNKILEYRNPNQRRGSHKRRSIHAAKALRSGNRTITKIYF